MGAPAILNFLRDMRVTAPPRETPAKIRPTFINIPWAVEAKADGQVVVAVKAGEPVEAPVRVPLNPAVSQDGDKPPKIVEFNLSQAAKELNVGYKAARRLCLTQGCARYSCGAGDEAIFPSTKSKRKGTNTRMTWKITPADIAAIKLAMRKK